MKTKKLTKEQRRIEVLNDVLLQIQQSKYKADQGVFVQLPKKLYDAAREKDTRHTQAQQYLLQEKQSCQVCAKGTLFLSIVRKESKVTLHGLIQMAIRQDTHDELFGKQNMDLVEAAFEGWYDENKCTQKDKILMAFYDKYYDPNERLSIIVENMIQNKGILKLNQLDIK